MTFRPADYLNFVAQDSIPRERLFLQYLGYRDDFDIVVIGSGMGGGILADDLADRLGSQKRILVLEAGSYLYPTHVFNICRFPNAAVAKHYACQTFWQWGNSSSENYIHEQPQLNFGGRSVFWSGLIPSIQPWELDFFPQQVRQDLAAKFLSDAGELMNESRSMGATARSVVNRLRLSPLAQHFDIQETPRALHQPYLTREGTPRDETFIEPTGVFNTAELLINQSGLTPGIYHGDGPGMHLLLNHYVEDIIGRPGDRYELVARNTLNGQVRHFHTGTVVLAGGSIESPKLLRRSTLFHTLPEHVKPLVGRGLTDHPTTDWIGTTATNIADIPLPRHAHAKIVFYSRGHRDAQNRIIYPFNVEMNINHEYWHLRENDPLAPEVPVGEGNTSKVELKFSFGNCLDNGNEVKPAPPFGYVPEISFKNLNWLNHLAGSRFPAVAGWDKNFDQIFATLNELTYRIFSQFQHYGTSCRPEDEIWFGQQNKDFGFGTVHHAVGTLRMPHRIRYDGPMHLESVVDENLRVVGTQNLFVCDMSVMPFSSAANPVRTLAGLALRLSQHLG